MEIQIWSLFLVFHFNLKKENQIHLKNTWETSYPLTLRNYNK